MRIPAVAQTVILLALSNVFMTFAWCAHLKELRNLWASMCIMGAVYFMFRT
jgi:uncharacterized protein (DUF486 family)